MNYLGIRTDSPEAELYLYSGDDLKAEYRWQADRQLSKELLGRIESFLHESNLSFNDLGGVFAYLGPGSFTGLRIGLTVINTIAYAEGIAVIGATGEGWRQNSLERLLNGQNDQVVLPLYGSDPHITAPKK